jgi:hypothetical protein
MLNVVHFSFLLLLVIFGYLICLMGKLSTLSFVFFPLMFLTFLLIF